MADCVVVSFQTATQFERATNLDIYHITSHYLYKMLAAVAFPSVYLVHRANKLSTISNKFKNNDQAFSCPRIKNLNSVIKGLLNSKEKLTTIKSHKFKSIFTMEEHKEPTYLYAQEPEALKLCTLSM